MKLLLLKLTLLAGPIGLVMAVAVVVVVSAGEFMDPERIVEIQTTPEPVLVGRAYVNDFAVHALTVRRRRPEVLVMGSSRVTQWRSLFFHKRPAGMYVLGSRQSVEHARAFLRDVSADARPAIVILGMDQRWFVERYALRPKTRLDADFASPRGLGHILTVSHQALLDLGKGKISLGRVLSHTDPVEGVRAVGVSAIMRGGGHRNDGSYQHGAQILTAQPLAPVGEEYELLRANAGALMSADDVWEPAIDELKGLLEDVRARGGIVIGFSPPFSPSLYRALRAGGRHEYLSKMVPRLEALFNQVGFAYFDFSDPSIVGGRDTDMLDYSHPSEYLNLLFYLSMVKARPDVFEPYSDVTVLERLLGDAPRNRFTFLRNRFSQ